MPVNGLLFGGAHGVAHLDGALVLRHAALMDDVVSRRMNGLAQKDLPILRHIAFDFAGADVHELDLEILGGDAGFEVITDCRKDVTLNSGLVVVVAALLALLLIVELFELPFGYHDRFFGDKDNGICLLRKDKKKKVYHKWVLAKISI